MTESIKAAQAFWDTLAEHDPLWAILSDSTRRGGRWDLATFFATGEREISTLMHQIAGLPGGPSAGRAAALDFGCGVGRLTQALAAYFTSVVGVDVSSAMIGHAERLNRRPDRVTYLQNSREDLVALGSRRFDLIYSDLVLQHMPPTTSLKYVLEFLRLMAPGGMLVFQLPSHRQTAPPPLVVPMPASSYRAGIEILKMSSPWTPGSRVRLEVRVANMSEGVWDQRLVGTIRLGNHWLTAAGAMLIQDDGRCRLPEVTEAGRTTVLALDVTVPEHGDRFLLELDLVHEGHSWFAEKGSATARLQVVPSAGGSTADQYELLPSTQRLWDESLLRPFVTPILDAEVAFPMHGVLRDEVVSFVTAQGGELLLAETDDRGGNEWTGFRYFIRSN